MVLPALSAVAILILSYKFPKQTGYLLLVVIAIIASIYMYNKSEANAEAKLKELVFIDVSYDISSCPIAKPLSVIIRNESNRIVSSASWSLKAFESGFSDNLAPFSYGPSFKSDKILNHNESVNLCYASPRLDRDNTPATANWLTIDKVIVFKTEPSLWSKAAQ
jgi:hypothetical protein